MKLAMYKGPATGFFHRIAHEFTCLWTSSDYSHCELVFGGPDRYGLTLCASSSGRDGGVRFQKIDLASGRWDVYEIRGNEEAAARWFVHNDPAGYDWFGLLWFVLPIKAFNSPRRYFCSEAIAAALGMPKPHKFHPQRLLEAALKA